MTINGKLTRSVTLSAQLWCEVPRGRERNIPKEYQEVEWLKGDGTAYIDTGFCFPYGNDYDFYFETLTEVNSATTSDNCVGGVSDITNNGYGVKMPNFCDDYVETQNISNGSNSFAAQLRDEPVLFTVRRSTAEYTVSYGNQTETSWNSYATVTTLKPIYLFAQNNGGTARWMFRDKIYSVLIEIDGEAVLDCVPCYRKEDGVSGMFDVATQTFFTNANSSGSFTVGGDV